MISKNIEDWADYFKRYDERLLERICEILPVCIAAMHDNPHEDDITINLIYRLRLDTAAREIFHHYEYQFEPFGFDEKGIAYSKGRIDFAAFWNKDPEKYLAYEVKRLKHQDDDGKYEIARNRICHRGVASICKRAIFRGSSSWLYARLCL